MPRNKYPEETVQKILKASMDLFLKKGYEQTTILDIVNGMGGMTRGAFYHHFKSKEEVFDALLDKLFQEDNPFQKVQEETDLNGLQKIQMVMQYSTEDYADEKRIAVSKIAMPLLSSPHFLAQHFKDNLEMAKMVQPLVEEGMADGSIQPGNAKLMSELIAVLFQVWMVPAFFPMDETEFEEKAMLIKQIFDNLGMPIMDDAFLEKGEVFAEFLGVSSSPDTP
ncbi:MAG: TetR/AcrR family transcriptional regulator [Oscillospiraceae bacterium]|nr:TetR/AcrR family transcriptional regulator [Oscillospiraceae bacterium]